MLELFIILLVGLLLVGAAYYVAAALLPHPIPLLVAVFGFIVLLLILVGNVDTGTSVNTR